MRNSKTIQLLTLWILAAIGFYGYVISHGMDAYATRPGSISPALLEPISSLIFIGTLLCLVAVPLYLISSQFAAGARQ